MHSRKEPAIYSQLPSSEQATSHQSKGGGHILFVADFHPNASTLDDKTIGHKRDYQSIGSSLGRPSRGHVIL